MSLVPSKILVACLLSLWTACSFSMATDQTFKNWHRNWNVKRGVADAQVIMAARVTHVGKIKVVEGAKTNQYFREYKFQPLKILKGVYSRDELTMSAADLGCRSAISVDAKDIQEDQIRILLLSQSNPFGSSFACAGVPSSANIRQSIPIISDLQDPIVSMYETMIKIDNLRSRKARANMLVNAIRNSSGPALVPLMQASRDDMIWCAASPDYCQALIAGAGSDDPIISDLAFELICDASHWQSSKSAPKIAEGFGKILKNYLTGKKVQTTHKRVRAFRAAIELEKIKRTNWLAKELDQVAFAGRTLQERRMAIQALGELKAQASLKPLVQQLKSMPLDTVDSDRTLLYKAVGNMAPDSAYTLITAQFEEALGAGLFPVSEFNYLVQADNGDVADFLVSLLDNQDASLLHSRIIQQIGKRQIQSAVPKLGNILRSQSNLSAYAQRALIDIGTRQAAVEVRPKLRTTRQLAEKLMIAKLLAKHGMKDGQSMAIEHLADGGLVSRLSAEVLLELNDQATKKQLIEIIRKNPDKKWYIGAVNGLLAMKHETGFKAFAGIISDDRHPLLLQALQLGDLAGKKSLFDHGAELIESRNDKIALTYLQQIKNVLQKEPLALAYVDQKDKQSVQVAFDPSMPELERKILKSLKKIVTDSYVNANVRKAAMNLLTQYDTKEIRETLLELVDRIDLRGFQTLAMAEKEILRREIQLKN